MVYSRCLLYTDAMRYDLERMDGKLRLLLIFTFWTPEVSRFNPGLSVEYPSRGSVDMTVMLRDQPSRFRRLGWGDFQHV